MWILTHLQPGGETHYLQLGKNYVVGRKNCDILLIDDQSISRAHAHLSVTEQTLTVKDTSKYGTFVNGERLSDKTPVNLTFGGNITFGVFNSKFRVEPLNPVVCSSCLENSGKASLSEALKIVGGKLVGTWSQDCTHLVMSKVKVTIKTICALLSARPIVTPEFFSALHTAIQSKSAPPEVDRFIPELNEPSLNKDKVKIGVISKRRELFAGKTFVFLNAKQMSRLSGAISFGGGVCRLLDEGSLPRDILESPYSCLIDVTSSASQTVLPPSSVTWINSVKSIVEKKGLRVIPEAEIGLAAIYASCDPHCSSSPLTDNNLKGDTNVKSRIPSTSQFQSLAVDETVLPAPSMNITAYAANTEPSQGVKICEVLGVSSVGETPEKQLKTKSPFFVVESENQSFNPVDSKHTIEESKLTDNSNGIQSHPKFAKPNGGTKVLSQKQSPQKTKTFGGSPQKQSSLTSFFKPAQKKRHLEDEIITKKSQSKRPALESSLSPQDIFIETRSEKPSTDLGSSEVKEDKTHSQKRKGREEIELDELESLMSEDFDFDEPPTRSQSQADASISKSRAKRQKLQDEETEKKNQQPDVGKTSTSSKTSAVKVKEQNVSVNIDAFERLVEKSNTKRSSDPPAMKQNTLFFTEGKDFVNDEELLKAVEVSSNVKPKVKTKSIDPPLKASAVKEQNKHPFADDCSEFVEDEELLSAESKVKKTAMTVKQEVNEYKMDDSLPKNLLLVEFRDLKVSKPPTRSTKPKQSNGCTKNFKCFHKVHSRGSAPLIRGADLLAHNTGRNSDLDEWLKDAAEEEQRSRREEIEGDNLFRYNPSKLARRR